MEAGAGQGVALLWAVAGLFGLVVGSFLNVVAHRLPAGESIVSPRSRCPQCRVQIRAIDNVPLLSWLWLRGRCRACGTSISARYPVVELVTGCLFAALAWRFGLSWLAPLYMIFGACLLAAALVDFDHQIIPDEISLGAGLFGLVAVPCARVLEGGALGESIVSSAMGAALGAGLLWSVGFAHARLSVATGRRFAHWPGEGEEPPRPASADYWLWFPGLGLGDVKLMGMIGVFVGPIGVVETVLCASLLGLVLGLFWAVFTKSLSTPFGFGPAIAGGAVVALFVPIHTLL